MFLDKNRDTMRSDLVELLCNSQSQVSPLHIATQCMPVLRHNTPSLQLVSDLFLGVMEEMKDTKKGTLSTRRKARTVAYNFAQSLGKLLRNMGKCNPFFVRCVKPNKHKVSTHHTPLATPTDCISSNSARWSLMTSLSWSS